MPFVSSQFAAVNREAIWAALFAAFKSQLTAPAWTANTDVTAGQVVIDPAGHLQKALTNGTTGATLPGWNDAGGETADGTGGTAFSWQDTGPGFVSMGRKHTPPPELTIPDQPAFFQVAGKEIHIPQKPPGMPSKLVLRGFLIVYCYNPSPSEDIGAEQLLGETILNLLLAAIDGAMQPDDPNTGKFTIGGLVTHCWIEGDTDLDPGIFGDQCAAILPLNILID
jgi:hypothetical protein